jgi:hypothetical protein
MEKKIQIDSAWYMHDVPHMDPCPLLLCKIYQRMIPQLQENLKYSIICLLNEAQKLINKLSDLPRLISEVALPMA